MTAKLVIYDEEARRALKSGIDALAERDTELPGRFLESELERREAVADAHAGRDVARLGALLEQVRSDAAALEGSLADQLDAEAWEDARSAVRELRFLSKVAGDIEAALAEVEG